VIIFVSGKSGIEQGTDKLGRLPPSSKLVWKVLSTGHDLTQKEIINATLLPPRTTRYAISRLREEGLLIERFSFKDARQIIYSVKRAGIT